MADETSLISRRYVLGPYPEPLFVLIEPGEGQQPDPRRVCVRFMKDNAETAERLKNVETTVYRLPPGQVSVVRLTEVKGSGYVFEVEQLPTKVEARDPRPFPPVGECASSCPPYTMNCPVPLQPDCSTGKLRCV